MTVNVSTNRWATSNFIVAPTVAEGAGYTTIQAAITAASSGNTIFIKPGTYTENLTLKAGVNLSCYECDAQTPNVTISGKCTATFAGTACFSGIRFQTNSDNAIEITGSSATVLRFSNCFFNVTSNSAFNVTSSSNSVVIFLYSCSGSLTTTGVNYFTIQNGTIAFFHCTMRNPGGSTTASTLSNASSADIKLCLFSNMITTSDTSSLDMENSDLFGAESTFTFNGTGTNLIANSRMSSGANSAISVGSGVTLNIHNVVIASSNANVITGAGTVRFSGVSFYDTSSTINTTTQTPVVSCNDAIKVVAPGAYPYTMIPQDAMILVDTSSARTINLEASPATGTKHIIKDNVGSAAANNITISGNGKNIDGAASYTINVAYGSVDLIYNGTEWGVY